MMRWSCVIDIGVHSRPRRGLILRRVPGGRRFGGVLDDAPPKVSDPGDGDATAPTALDERFRALPVTDLPNGLRLIEARTRRSRRRGLARLDALPRDVALHIPGTPSVHTFGMRFALDLIWLRKDGTVARIDRDVGARRVTVCPAARSVVEAAAGMADAFIAAGVGDRA
jgi:uncharacterized protein